MNVKKNEYVKKKWICEKKYIILNINLTDQTHLGQDTFELKSHKKILFCYKNSLPIPFNSSLQNIIKTKNLANCLIAN